MSIELRGVVAGDTIRQGEFFRATWIFNSWSYALPESLELNVLETTFENIPQRTGGVAMAVSSFEAVAGDKAMTVDLVIRPAGNGIAVGDLARILDGVRASLDLHILEKIDQNVASDSTSRDAATKLADSDQRFEFPTIGDELAKFGSTVKFLVVAVVVLALAVVAWKGLEAWKR